MKNILLISLCCCVTTISFGQTNKHLAVQLRQSFSSAATRPKPAAFTYTNPEGKPASYLIDAALGLTYPIGQSANAPILGLIGELHRNTLVEQQQYTIQGGATMEWFTNPNFNSMGGDSSGTAVLNFTGEYKDNRIKEAGSELIIVEATLLGLPKNPSRFYPNTVVSLGKFNTDISSGSILDFYYSPSIGIEQENRFRAKTEDDKGNIVRGFAKLYAGVRPFPVFFESRLKPEIFADLEHRYDAVNTTGISGRSHPLSKVGINFILIGNNGSKFAKLEFSYNNGSNPAEGLEDQRYYLVALKVKI